MRKADGESFVEALTAMSELYGRPMSEGQLALWWSCLEPYPIERVLAGLRAAMLNPDNGQFMPRPADVVRQIEGTTGERAMLAWSLVMRAVREAGAYTDVAFDDLAIAAAIADLGGWPKICRCELRELSFMQHAFTRAYDAHRQAGTSGALALRGDCSSEAEFQAVGLSPPEPMRFSSQPARSKAIGFDKEPDDGGA